MASQHLGKGIRPWRFWTKRLIRIFPSYWLFLFSPMVLTFLLFPGTVGDQAAFEYVHLTQSFFLVLAHKQFCQVTWTLSYELVFYFLFGLLFFSKKLVVLAFLFVGAGLASLTYSLLYQGLPFHQSPLLGAATSPMFLEFALGVMVGRFCHKRARPLVLGSLGVLSYVVLFATNADFGYYLELYRVLAFGIPSSFIIYSLVYMEQHDIWRISRESIWVKVGEASYVLYLIHSPIVSLVVKRGLLTIDPMWKYPGALVVILGIVGLSFVVHYKIERPVIGKLRYL